MIDPLRTGRRSPLAPAAALLAARSLAWASLFGGWLVLGGLARHHGPGGALSLAPQALWLLTVAVSARLARDRADTAGGAAAAVAATGLATALAIALVTAGGTAGLAAWGLWLAAVAWGTWLVAASRVVRHLRLALRAATGDTPAGPAVPAALGAWLAWWVAGDPVAVAATPGPAAVASAAAALLLATLAWHAGTPPAGPRPGCRAGLFDCALAWPAAAAWRRRADWPRLAAGLTMLPMMASLPWMADRCAAAGWTPSQVVALHLAAMLGPALLFAAGRPAAVHRLRPAATVALLAAGGAAALLEPGPSGLLVAMLLQGMAWGVGASFTPPPGVSPDTSHGDPAAPPTEPGKEAPQASVAVRIADEAVRLTGPAAALMGLGAAMGTTGPTAWVPLHIALGAIALLGLRVRRPDHPARAACAATTAPVRTH